MKTKPTVGLIALLKTEYGVTEPVLDTPDDGIEGSTYIVTDGKQKCVVKLYDDNLQAETVARFQDRLFAAGLPVPAIVPTKSGNLTARLDDNTVVLSSFATGGPIGWGKEFASLAGPLTVDIAGAVANMHIISRALDFGTGLDHPLDVKHLLNRLDDNTKIKLPTDSLMHARKALIHADLARENVFLTESQNTVRAIIDFGDAHFDYITYDIAILLTQVYVTKSWGVDFAGIKEFLASYSLLNPLQHAELQTILPLMELRNRGLLQEIEQRLDEDDADTETLDSIRQSLTVKLQLLQEHSERLEGVILGA